MANDESHPFSWKHILTILGIVISVAFGSFWIGNSFRVERLQNLEKENAVLKAIHLQDSTERFTLQSKVDSLSVILASKKVLPDTALRMGDAVSIFFGETTIFCDSIDGGRRRGVIRVYSDNPTFKGIKDPNVYPGDIRDFYFRGKKYRLNVGAVKNHLFKQFSSTELTSVLAVKISVYRAEQ